MRRFIQCVLICAFAGSPGCAQTVISNNPLGSYLGLTKIQENWILQLNQDYASYLKTVFDQLNTIDQSISQLYAQGVPGPSALGNLYLNQQAIRKDMTEHQTRLVNQTVEQLTSAQVALLSKLGESITLQPLAQDAACAFLMPAVSNTVPAAVMRSGDFSYSGSATSVPSVPPAPSGAFCGSTEFPISIRELLGITDAQVAAVAAASAAYNDYYGKQLGRMNDLAVNIEDETGKESPDPAALGFFYSQLAAIGRDVQKKQADLQQQAQILLSNAQKAELKKITDSAALLPVAQRASYCHLLAAPSGTNSLPLEFLVLVGASSCQF